MLHHLAQCRRAFVLSPVIAFLYCSNLSGSSFFRCFSKTPQSDLVCLTQEAERSYKKERKNLEQTKKKYRSLQDKILKTNRGILELESQVQILERDQEGKEDGPEKRASFKQLQKKKVKLLDSYKKLALNQNLKTELLEKSDIRGEEVEHRRKLLWDLKAISGEHAALFETFKQLIVEYPITSREFRVFIRAIAQVESPKAWISLINFFGDDGLDLPRDLELYKNIHPAQALAFISAQSSGAHSANLPEIRNFAHIRNQHLLDLFLENKISADLQDSIQRDAIAHIETRQDADLFRIEGLGLDQIPKAFIRFYSSLPSYEVDRKQWLLQTVQALQQREGRIAPETWSLIQNLRSPFSREGFEHLLKKGGFHQSSISSSFERDRVTFKKVVPLLRNQVQVDVFKYLLDLSLEDPVRFNLISKELRLHRLTGKMVHAFSNPASFDYLKSLVEEGVLEAQYQGRLQNPEFPSSKKPASLKHVVKMNEHQLAAMRSAPEADGSHLLPGNFRYISNAYQVEALKLLSSESEGQKSKILETIHSSFTLQMLQEVQKRTGEILPIQIISELERVGYSQRDRIEDFFRQETFSNFNEYCNAIRLSLKAQSRVQMQAVSLLKVDPNIYDLLLDSIDQIDNSNQLRVVRHAVKQRSFYLTARALSISSLTTTPEMANLAVALMDANQDLAFIKSIGDGKSILDLVKELGIETHMHKASLAPILEALPNEALPDTSVQESQIHESKTEGRAQSLQQYINEHPSRDRIQKHLQEAGLRPCPTGGCSACVAPSAEHNFKCALCNAQKCFKCGGHYHKGSCEAFERNGRMVSSKDYPGFGNFRSGLANICYFNASVKMLTKLASEVRSLRDFLNPQLTALPEVSGKNSGPLNQARSELQTSLHELIESTLSGIDINEDLMCEKINRVFSVFEQVVRIEGFFLNGILRSDQFDAHQILNLILRSVGFDRSPFMLELENIIRPEGHDIRSMGADRTDMLSLPLAANHNIQFQVDQMWKPESLDQDNLYFLEEENRYVTADKSIRVVNAPEILLLQLKRYTYVPQFGRLEPKRVDTKVKLNQHLRVLRYDPGDLSGQPAEELTYQRVSAVIHQGSQTLNFGHYRGITWEDQDDSVSSNFVANFARNARQTIVCHDDSTVSCHIKRFSTIEKEIETGAYLVAYRLVRREKRG